MNDILAQLKNVWSQMDTTRRVIAVVVLLLITTTVIVVAIWGSKPKYELLYSRLNETDRSEIISKLDEMKVPYRTTMSGGIEVPNALSVRASLLSAGIPRGGVVGWEIFDKNSFSSTDFTNQINRQRAIAGELTRTLQKLDGITDAQILLNLPDSDEYIFADDKPEGTASVQLQLRAPGVLSEAQVEAITNLVATSAGIKGENVTIIDNFANDLTAVIRQKRGLKPGTTSASGLFSAKLEYETQLEQRLEGMLSKVFGFNKSVVRVNADLDLDYQEIKSETFGDKGVPRSEQERTETARGTGSYNGGVPGTDSNITQYKAGDGGNSNYAVEKSDRTVNYEINKVEEFRIAAPGKVNRLTVGVWVDGNLPANNKQKVFNTVAAAVGYSEDRGDNLTVETIKFTPPPKIKPDNSLKIDWQPILAVLVIVGIFAFLVVVTKRILPSPKGTATTAKTTVETLDALGSQFDTLVDDKTKHQLGITVELSPEEKARIERLETIEKMAKEKPGEVAVLLKAWLAEE